MEEKLIVANWKANKTLQNALSWIDEVGPRLASLKKKVIFCPSMFLIVPLSQKIAADKLSDFLILGSQNISHFSTGSYTGEVAAEQAADFIKFTLVGHSERRRYFGETKEQVAQKYNLAKKFGITPVFCFDTPQIEEVFELSDNNLICAFEPLSAIGTGNPDTPENVGKIVTLIKSKNPTAKVLYGGSVTNENIVSFATVCDGALIGKASLESSEFLKICEKV